MKIVIANLRKYRSDNILTWKQLGIRCGVPYQTLWAICNEKKKPTELTIAKILKAIPSLKDE